tara:strand:+ start:14923 stop:16149 length:1227 start_codon:yes stop_codon:yes gene_type:complete
MGLLTLDFPREVLDIQASGAKGYRRLVSNTGELERYWRGKNGLANVYMTVYGYRSTRPPKHHRCDYNTPVIRHFVMDFDCKDFRSRKEVGMGIPLQQVRSLHQYLLDNDIKHGVWFSGGGFHVWVTLDKAHMPTSGREVSRVKEAGRRLLSGWENELGLTCSDPAVPFDTAGMIRIPNSYNDKKGLWCIPLKTHELMGLGEEDIMELALRPRKGYFNYGEKGATLNVKEQAPTPFKMNSPKMNIATAKMDGVKILPCLNAVACQEGNPDHYPRVYLAQFLLHRLRMFFPRSAQTESEREKAVGEVIDYMSTLGWADWDENTTRKHVRHIAETYDDHPTCATLFGKGYCLGKCQFHDGTGVIHAEALGGGDMGDDTSLSPAPSGNPSVATSAIITSSHSLPMVEGGEPQ